jgi:hypothetical protein
VRPIVAVLVLILVSCTVAGCVVNRRDDAQDLDRHLGTMPGVADTEMRYSSDFTNGEAFDLTVTLGQAITETQVREVAGYFADHTAATGLAEDSAELSLRLPIVPPPQKSLYNDGYSEARFEFGRSTTSDNPTADEIADSAAAWLRAARSPVAAEVTLAQPISGGEGDSRAVRVTMRPGATQADALALQATDRALANASWGISLEADNTYRPHTYYSTPRPPRDADLQTWREVSALVGATESASGRTDVPAQRGKQAETAVEFGLPDGYGSEADARQIAFGVAALLRRFDRPVEMTAQTGGGPVELIVGGCYRHDADHRPQSLEVELSKEYESC